MATPELTSSNLFTHLSGVFKEAGKNALTRVGVETDPLVAQYRKLTPIHFAEAAARHGVTPTIDFIQDMETRIANRGGKK